MTLSVVLAQQSKGDTMTLDDMIDKHVVLILIGENTHTIGKLLSYDARGIMVEYTSTSTDPDFSTLQAQTRYHVYYPWLRVKAIGHGGFTGLA